MLITQGEERCTSILSTTTGSNRGGKLGATNRFLCPIKDGGVVKAAQGMAVGAPRNHLGLRRAMLSRVRLVLGQRWGRSSHGHIRTDDSGQGAHAGADGRVEKIHEGFDPLDDGDLLRDLGSNFIPILLRILDGLVCLLEVLEARVPFKG